MPQSSKRPFDPAERSSKARPAPPALAARPPAPQPADGLSRPLPARLGKPAADRRPFFSRLGVRRTVIPVLLTLSALLPAVAVVGLLSRVEAPLHLNGGWAIGLVVLGAACAAVAALNMLAVRRELAPSRPAYPSRPTAPPR